mgnify:CR=1 FL=1
MVVLCQQPGGGTVGLRLAPGLGQGGAGAAEAAGAFAHLSEVDQALAQGSLEVPLARREG